jgi:hypothetical protein
VLDTEWHQPIFVVNFLPAYLATLTAHIVIMGDNHLQWTELEIAPTAYLKKSFTQTGSKSKMAEPKEIVVTTPAAPRDRKAAPRKIQNGVHQDSLY